MSEKRILIVDDEMEVTSFFRYFFEGKNCKVAVANSGREVDHLLHSSPLPFHLALIDMKLPDTNGLELLRTIKEKFPSCEVLIMTGYSTVKTAVQAIQAGAKDYLEKPFDDLDNLETIIDSLLQQTSQQEKDLRSTAGQYGIIYAPGGPMDTVLSMASKLAKKAINILIIGETGTGKELMARFIHESSLRSQHPFVGINCGAVPQALLESELFGHEKGAFTGAGKTRKGYFELANHGTLFLDEIGEAPLDIQVKLLRVLETGEFMRVGGEDILKSNIRVISATHRHLEHEIEKNRFRSDLLYRLEGVKLEIPPLRERPEDIPLIANYYLQRKFDGQCEISDEAITMLKNCPWPGNVRQLINVLNQTVAIHECSIIKATHLHGRLKEMPTSPVTEEKLALEEYIRREKEKFIHGIVESIGSLEDIEFNELMKQMKDLEAQVGRRIILKGLNEVQGNRKLLSEKLDITPRILRYILNEK
ncbi:sigma-54 dependent transcriptional regulator [Ammoniphilus sp. CFH 90114]|uniref:sigma-54-dependent transcriptional regulator n=1 Tax=Ammoniphilus sp. CFH 90114 TaxID=2493665 RepID=UPI00100E794B|nr:sigma-54 dependent transcriptional regulator [Ammoniphilus sp. CFH 90114]RXT07235.1 sigma-54-dependent Fis family transcriptional regulator [Ammoniphilus sp. CFH 90114]